MRRELKSTPNGENGATTITLKEITKTADNKLKRSQIGKLSVRKCSIVWHDGYETGNNKYQVDWNEFIEFMKRHPARKGLK